MLLLGFETVPDLLEASVIATVLEILKPQKPVWIAWSCKDGQNICCGAKIAEAIKIVENCQ